MHYIGESDLCGVYIDNEGRLNIERKITSGRRVRTLMCRYNGKMWNSKISDTILGDEYLSSGTLEKISDDIEKKLNIKIVGRRTIDQMLSDYFVGKK